MRKFNRSNNKTLTKGHKFKKIFLGVFAVIVFILIAKLLNTFINTKNIKVLGGDLSCVNKQTLEKTISFEIKNVFFYNSQKIKDKFKQKYYCIADINIKRTKITDLLITIKERIPIAIIKPIPPNNLKDLIALTESTASSEAANINYPDFSIQNSSSTFYLVDELGVVLSKAQENKSNLPLIYFVSDDLDIGRVILRNKVKELLSLIEKIRGLALDPKTVKVEDEMVLVDSIPKLVFGLNRDLNYQLASLQLILQKAKMNSGDLSTGGNKSKQIEMINLRFDKPVVRYNR